MTGVRTGLAGSALALGRLCERVGHLAAYVAAGAMRSDELQAAIGREWLEFGARQSAKEIAGGLFDWEQDFYARALEPGGRLLVVGCGAGRDLIALVKLGYRVEGLDVVASLARAARVNLARHGLDARVTTGPVETAPLDGPYDAIVFSWFTYSYIPRSSARVAVLARLRRHLAPHGRILLTFIPGEPGSGHAIRVCRLVGRLTRSDWRAEPGDVFLAGGGQLSNYQHHFVPGEIEGEAAAAGLHVLWEERPQQGLAVLAG